MFKFCVKDQKKCFHVTECMICAHKMSIKRKIKSFTINLKIFNIDDDGIRNVMSLEFLHFLQKILDSNLFLFNFFDQIFDTNLNKNTHSSVLYRELKTT